MMGLPTSNPVANTSNNDVNKKRPKQHKDCPSKTNRNNTKVTIITTCLKTNNRTTLPSYLDHVVL